MNLFNSTISAIQDLFKTKKISVQEYIEESINNIKKDKTNSVITICEDFAIAKAKELDNMGYNDNMPLFGMSMGVKDVFCTKGIRTTCASKMLENFIPDYDSTVTKRLEQAGAINVAKLNQDEFCMGSGSTNSYFKPVVNPYSKNIPLVAGGSSGGSAAAVANNLCQFSLGTDTGGSVRLPASFCNLLGIRTTYGRLSRYGIISFASSLDQAGFLTKHAEDMATLMSVSSGPDVNDNTTYAQKETDFIDKSFSFKGKKVGVLKESFADEVNSEIKIQFEKAVDFCKEHGAQIEVIEMPNSVKYSVDVYYAVASAEMATNLARFDGLKYGGARGDFNTYSEIFKKSRTECFGQEVKKRILIGNTSLSSEGMLEVFEKGAKIRRLVFNEFKETLKEFDFICTPTSSSFPFEIENNLTDRQMWFNDIFTIPNSLSGMPSISIPLGLNNSEKLPLGFQLISDMFTEKSLISAAYFFEKNFHE